MNSSPQITHANDPGITSACEPWAQLQLLAQRTMNHKAHVKQRLCDNLSGTEPLSQDFKPERQEQCIQIQSGDQMQTSANKKSGE